MHTHGPHSAQIAAPASDTIWSMAADWSSAGAEFVLENGYTDAPVVTAKDRRTLTKLRRGYIFASIYKLRSMAWLIVIRKYRLYRGVQVYRQL